jgi:hypothetical protein
MLSIGDARARPDLANSAYLGPQKFLPKTAIDKTPSKLMVIIVTVEIRKVRRSQYGVMLEILKTRPKSSATQLATSKQTKI